MGGEGKKEWELTRSLLAWASREEASASQEEVGRLQRVLSSLVLVSLSKSPEIRLVALLLSIVLLVSSEAMVEIFGG